MHEHPKRNHEKILHIKLCQLKAISALEKDSTI